MSSYTGSYRGVVTDNVDPGAANRLAVMVPDVSAEFHSWAMPGDPSAALPGVGDMVTIHFQNGDEVYPIWTAGTAGTGPESEQGPAAGYGGTYAGTVLDNADPGGGGRVSVQVPDVSTNAMWAAPEQAGAALPAIGDEVWIRFENGSADHALWSGGSGTGGAPGTSPGDGDGGGGSAGSGQPSPTTAYHGSVLDNTDPAGEGRLNVQVPEVSTAAMWATAEQPGAALPAIGDSVTVHFPTGDRDHSTWSQ